MKIRSNIKYLVLSIKGLKLQIQSTKFQINPKSQFPKF